MLKEKKKKKRNFNQYDPVPIPDKGLASVLYFDGSDLAANRNGEMSESQAAHLHNQRQNFWFEIGAAAVFIVLTVLSFLASEVIGAMALFVLLVILLPYLVWRKHEQNKRINYDIEDGKVWFAMGQVILDQHSPNGRVSSMRYMMTVSSTTFELNKDVFLRFKHLDYYNIYFAPLSRIILSAEPAQPA
jgi:hypothetical protein